MSITVVKTVGDMPGMAHQHHSTPPQQPYATVVKTVDDMPGVQPQQHAQRAPSHPPPQQHHQQQSYYPQKADIGVPLASQYQAMPQAPMDPHDGYRWNTGLLACGDDAQACLDNFLCMQCQNSRQYNVLHYSRRGIEPVTLVVSIVCDTMFASLFPGSCYLACHNRGAIRERYGIVGNCFGDLCATAWCMPCVTCQNYREMSIRGEWPEACCVDEPFKRLSQSDSRLPPSVSLK